MQQGEEGSLENVNTSLDTDTNISDTNVNTSLDISDKLDQIIYLQKSQFFCDVSLVVLILVLILGVGWRDWKH